jgi:hypothetical protein
LVVVAFAICYIISWKYYCTEWRNISDKSLLRVLLEKVVFPLLTIYLVTPKRLLGGVEELDSLLVFLGFLFYLSAVDVDSSISRVVYNQFKNMNALNRKYLYSTFPPRGRSDIYPFDFIIFLFTSFMVLRKLVNI